MVRIPLKRHTGVKAALMEAKGRKAGGLNICSQTVSPSDAEEDVMLCTLTNDVLEVAEGASLLLLLRRF